MTQFAVENKADLTDRISAFTLRPLHGASVPDWSAGAHVDIDLGDAGSRSYSLISWPGETPSHYRIAVQMEPDGTGGSRAVHALRAGDEVTISEPKNSFALRESPAPVALIAGGIGVTPLISMATELTSNGHPFVMHYAGRSADVMAYRDPLEKMLGDKLHCHYDDQAPLDLSGVLAGLRDHAVYICGPKGMIDAARAAAEAVGIASDMVHVELFTAPDTTSGDTGFEVEIASTGTVYQVPAGQTIIEALEAAGVDVIYDCQRGDCGICQCDVISGIPDHRDVVLSQAEKDAGNIMQICVSRALSDRLVLDM